MPEGGRVIAGTARGVRLEAPPSETRPLSDRVKESLFASLESSGSLKGSFLDLFAGSGAGGIEALSRGAPSATFVERDPKAVRVIDVNLRRAHLRASTADPALLVERDVLDFLREGRPAGAAFSGVLADPPYAASVLEQVLQLLSEKVSAWLTPDALVVAKHFWKHELPEHVGELVLTRKKRFGETMLSYYTRKRGSDLGLWP
jgi:16S rRNA (guanine966-N2)-methyltransferase